MPHRGTVVPQDSKWAVCSAYFDALGLADASAQYSKSIWNRDWKWNAARGRDVPAKPQWTHLRGPISPTSLHHALFAGDGLYPAETGTTSIVVIDFDPAPSKVISLSDHLAKGPKAKRLLAERRCGERVRRLLARWPDLPWYLEHTGGRGYHAALRLTRPVSTDCANAIGRRLVAGLELDHVEVFPHPEGRSARHCALPCTGRSRAVQADLVTLVHRRGQQRIADAIAFLNLPAVEPEALLDGTSGKFAEAPKPAENKPIAAPMPAAGVDSRSPLKPLADDGHGLPQTRNRKGNRAWDAQVRQILQSVPDDCSWRAVEKFAAAAHYRAISRERAERELTTWMLDPRHQADHFRDRGGRTQLRAVFRNRWKRCERGVREGWLTPGRWRVPPDVAARFDELDRAQTQEAA